MLTNCTVPSRASEAWAADAQAPNPAPGSIPLRGTIVNIEVGDELQMLSADPFAKCGMKSPADGIFSPAWYDEGQWFNAGDVGMLFLAVATKPSNAITKRYPVVLDFSFRGIAVCLWFVSRRGPEAILAKATWFADLLDGMAAQLRHLILPMLKTHVGSIPTDSVLEAFQQAIAESTLPKS
jgi:hypothetical protein